ncbi:response regulator transcription factor [Pararhodobacter sp. SW119]|uniref:response regulator transcription factor n=1 Tax=Pararhodobacter sp. SW119 TaxID=2780075 RepID=UPI001ADED940|nr:response regulator transcription factor [Pararhodobacter sp. SW119]
MKSDRLLIVEDDEEIAAFLHQGLAAEGYLVDLSSAGEGVLARVADGSYRMVILDRMLPDAEGVDLCRKIRAAGSNTMIMMLTAKDALAEKLEGLGAGADDYMTKPFAFEELLARIEVLLRRAPTGPELQPEIVVGDLRIDPVRKTAKRAGRDLDLTATEFALLHFLAARADTVLSRVEILKGVWGYSFDPHTNIVEVYIAYLRRKVEQEGEEKLIHTQRGFGYVLSKPHGADTA